MLWITFGEGGGWKVIFIPVSVAPSKVVELTANKAAKSGAHQCPPVRFLCQAPCEQVDVIHLPGGKGEWWLK